MSAVAGGVGRHAKQQFIAGENADKAGRCASRGIESELLGNFPGPGNQLWRRNRSRLHVAVDRILDLTPTVLPFWIGRQLPERYIVETQIIQCR